jgi:hypothetical protein
MNWAIIFTKKKQLENPEIAGKTWISGFSRNILIHAVNKQWEWPKGVLLAVCNLQMSVLFAPTHELKNKTG